MAHQPHQKVIVTCAITGNLTRPEQSPYLPITPQQIADSALEAAEAGASIAHIHVRDPETGRPSMSIDLYRDVMDRIRGRNNRLIINLTTGPGGRFVPSEEDPKVAGPGTTLMAPERRVEHVEILRPEICTLDLNTMNSGGQVVINTPPNVRRMAARMRAAGALPELELFDSGDIHLARDLIADGTLQGPPLCTLVLGVKYGFDPSPETMLYARNLLPSGSIWAGFGIGRAEFPMVAQSWLLGGHVRVGLEDNLYMAKGVLAKSNAELVAHAARILKSLGAAIALQFNLVRLLVMPTMADPNCAGAVAEAAAEGAVESRMLGVADGKRDIDDPHVRPRRIGQQRKGPPGALALDERAEGLAGFLEQAMDVAIGHTVTVCHRLGRQLGLVEVHEHIGADGCKTRGSYRPRPRHLMRRLGGTERKSDQMDEVALDASIEQSIFARPLPAQAIEISPQQAHRRRVGSHPPHRLQLQARHRVQQMLMADPQMALMSHGVLAV